MPSRVFSCLASRSSVLALAAGAAALSTVPEQASAAGLVEIAVSEPEGFSNLTSEQTLVVDLYFGGIRRGEATIVAAPGTVRLVDVDAAIRLLPPLSERASVAAALSASLSANAQFACVQTSDPQRCGRLSPEVAGVIFDRDRFRLDIFVNPRFLTVADVFADDYLPEPEQGIAVINSLGAVISGGLGGGSDFINFQDQLVVGSGARRLRAEISYASELGLGADRIAAEWDQPGLRYSVGALWAPGSEIAGQRKLIGAGLSTQIDTRLDRDELLGSPIVVYLERRARVDIMRDGRVLTSAIYEAGNQQIDTSNLPDGSYGIELRIEEPGRPARVERRFYTKSRRIPSLGRTDFFAFGGLLIDEMRRGSLDPSDQPYFQGGVVRRIDENWALGGAAEATDVGAAGELTATWLTPFSQVRVSAVADTEGTYGGIVQLASSGSSQLSYTFDLRRIEAGEAGAGFGVSRRSFAAAPRTFDPAAADSGYSQASGIVSYSLANLRFLGTFFYRDGGGASAARYSIGPSIEWDFLRAGPFTFTLRSDITATERGSAGFAGVSLRLLGGRSAFTALAGARFTGIDDDPLGDGPVAVVSGAWSPTLAGGDLALGAGYDRRPGQDDLVLSSDFRHPLGSLSGDLVRTDGPGESATQYSLGLQTTLIAGAGALQFAGRTTTESMVVARVRGARKADTFEVLVNEQLAGTIAGEAPLQLALPSYRAYTLRIRPTAEALLAYDSAPRTVTLYPGTVASLDWRVEPISIKFGRLLTPDGRPVSGAVITGKDVWSETDDAGNFQIEAADGIELTVRTRDGHSFVTTLPPGVSLGGIARVGAIVCCGNDGVRLGALDIGPLEQGEPK